MPLRSLPHSVDQNARFKCNTGQYHSVIALSESMINKQLESYYRLEDEFKYMKGDMGIFGSIDVSLNPSRIAIPALDQNKSSVYFFVCISKGNLTYLTETGSKVTIAVSNWDLAYSCNITGEGVDKNELEGLKKALKVEGEYSIQRLLLNFADANLSSFNRSRSKLPMADGEKIPNALEMCLSYWTRQWLAKWDKIEERLVKGYVKGDGEILKCPILYHALAPKPENVNPIAPSLPPTALTHQTFASRRNGEPHPVAGQNCLLYLEMCGNDSNGKPHKLPPILNFECEGSFVAPDIEPPIAGTMCLSGNVFFGEYLVDFLKPVIKNTELVLSYVDLDQNGVAKWSYTMGDNNNHMDPKDNYYKMKRMSGTDELYKNWFNNTVRDMKNENGWRWVSQSGEGGHGEQVKIKQVLCKYNGLNFNKLLSVHGRSLCNLTYTPGGNVATLRGFSTVVLDLRLSDDPQNPKLRDQVAASAVWSVDFIFDAVDNGKVFIDVKYPEDLVKVITWINPNSGFGQINTHEVEKEMIAFFKDRLMQLKSYFNSLRDVLRNQAFVLSGGGYFFMSNPAFSKNGDLLFELVYNGIPEDGELETFREEKPTLKTIGISPVQLPKLSGQTLTGSVSYNPENDEELKKKAEILEKERLEAARLKEKKERLEKERLEKERLEKEEKERLEKEEKERLEKERLEKEEKERLEKERLEKEEKERLEKEEKEISEK